MYFQFRGSLPDQMLTKVDRMSMAHSLKTRALPQRWPRRAS
ncbi:MAG: hypothetical protein U0802_13395 [Candidatus Binatia bacterium]